MWQGILFEVSLSAVFIRTLHCLANMFLGYSLYISHMQIDPSKTYDRLADIFYDAIDERIAIKERVKEGQERDHFYEIFLYQKV